MGKRSIKFVFNAPITLGFCAICLVALLLNYLTNGYSNILIFSTYGSSLLDPLTYVRLFMHVFGHADLSHFISNITYILLLGPMLEEKYHDRLIIVILITALVTGIVHNIIDPNVYLLGASGIVFSFILLASITGKSDGIPITLILVAILWLGDELINSVYVFDNISQLTHIIGGISGTILGFYFRK